jgi:DNA polymerase III sliding clamp (beta) subunit (PCNA family)
LTATTAVFTETDLKTTATAIIDLGLDSEIKRAEGVNGKGVVLADARMLLKIVSTFPDGLVELSCRSNNANSIVILKTGSAFCELTSLSPSEFPAPAPSPAPFAAVDSDVFLGALAFCTPAVCTDENRPTICGVNMKVRGSQIEMAATDTHMLMVRTIDVVREDGGTDITYLISSREVKHLTNLLAKRQCLVMLCHTDAYFYVQINHIGGISVHYRSLNTHGLFPSYERVLPSPDKITCAFLFPRLEVVKAAQAATVVSSLGAAFRCRFKTETIDANAVEVCRLTISARVYGIGEISRDFPISRVPNRPDRHIQIAFNSEYIRKVLAAMSGDDVIAEFTDCLGASLFKQVDGNGYALVMPMQDV